MTDQTPKPGHNSGVAGDELKRFLDRIERINAEIADLTTDRKDIFLEAKSRGFDTATIRRIVSERKKDDAKRAEAELLFDTYCSALGIFG